MAGDASANAHIASIFLAMCRPRKQSRGCDSSTLGAHTVSRDAVAGSVIILNQPKSASACSPLSEMGMRTAQTLYVAPLCFRTKQRNDVEVLVILAPTATPVHA